MTANPAPPAREGWRNALRCAGVGLLFLLLTLPCAAQNSANATIDVYKDLAAMPDTALGLGVAVWDNHMTDPVVHRLIEDDGIKILRYPGGSYADIYHWKTNSATKGVQANIQPQDNFLNFMTLARRAGATPLITVNYGSNAEGTGGGDPSEAASWVRYANVTKKWDVRYWEIGNEVYGNGFYGATWEEDLHAPYPANPADNNKARKGDPRLSPTAYGDNVRDYITDMKAQDPSIKIGAVLITPGNWPDGVKPDWNSHVLAECGPYIDFVVLHWYSSSKTTADLLDEPAAQLPKIVRETRALIDRYCGANAKNVQIWITEGDASGFNTKPAGALFAAEEYLTWIENGVANFDWWDLHNGLNSDGHGNYDDQGILSNASSVGTVSEPPANTPFPPYYGIRMVHDLARPGDVFVAASSDNPSLAVYADRRRDGDLGVMLINRDPNNPVTVHVSVANSQLAPVGFRYDYRPGALSVTSSKLKQLGNSFTVAVPAYTITDILVQERHSADEP